MHSYRTASFAGDGAILRVCMFGSDGGDLLQHIIYASLLYIVQ